MEHDEYLKRRDELLKIRTESFGSFDKAILSLSTGSLALSITFLDKIGMPFNLLTITLIFVSWAAFFFVIVANLLSYLLAKTNMDRKIYELDSKYQKEIDTGQAVKEVEKTFWQRKAINICNICAFVLFVVGVATFTYYIVEIQKHNYADLIKSQEEEKKQMAIKKTGGVTETKAAITQQTTTPKGTQFLSEGQTEQSQAISKPALKQSFATTNVSVESKGQTEVHQAIQRPAANPQNTSQGKK
jgi:hypothetical protein